MDAASDIETINTELILADLQTMEKVITRLEKEVRIRKGDPAVLRPRPHGQGDSRVRHWRCPLARLPRKLDLADVREFNLLTAKPFIYVFNTDDAGLLDAEKKAELAAQVAPAEAIFLDAQVRVRAC